MDHTHDLAVKSWVESGNGHAEFPLQNLPMGVWDHEGGRLVTAIGDQALDLREALALGLLPDLDVDTQAAVRSSRLNAWMALGAQQRTRLRHAIHALLREGSQAQAHAARLLHARAALPLRLPADIGNYTDFYAGMHHARNVGRLFRPTAPLMPNYCHLPIAYHGRSSSVQVSDTDIRRPWGQVRNGEQTVFSPTLRLDFELEFALWAGPGNVQGEPIPLARAGEHLAGFGLFNDWSARDIQAWEYQPLGPFQGKNFASTISAWVVTTDAMAPFRRPAAPRDADHPELLAYLFDQEDQASGALDVALEVWLSSEQMRREGMPAVRLSQSHTQHLYWTPGQMLAHHTIGGCNICPGDLLATGTISTPGPQGMGSLLEMTEGGKLAMTLPSGEQRLFIEDGDEIVLRASARTADGYTIGFGECRSRVLPAWNNPMQPASR